MMGEFQWFGQKSCPVEKYSQCAFGEMPVHYKVELSSALGSAFLANWVDCNGLRMAANALVLPFNLSSAFSFALSSSSEQCALFNFGLITIEEGRSICWLAIYLSTQALFYQVDWYFSPSPSLFLFMSRITFVGILSL